MGLNDVAQRCLEQMATGPERAKGTSVLEAEKGAIATGDPVVQCEGSGGKCGCRM